MYRKKTNIIIAGVVLAAFIVFFIFVYLPYSGQQNQKNKFDEAVQASQLLREPLGEIPHFSFTDQSGNTFSSSDVDGKVYVADFIYTSCEASCPMMTSQLTKVQDAVSSDEPFRIVSFSLDPENDSVPVLKSFADKFKANDETWHFLTGDKDSIYQLGTDGFMQSVLADTGSMINHTQKLILVDQRSMIRGFYNSMDSIELQLLIRDIHYLLHKDDAYE